MVLPADLKFGYLLTKLVIISLDNRIVLSLVDMSVAILFIHCWRVCAVVDASVVEMLGAMNWKPSLWLRV